MIKKYKCLKMGKEAEGGPTNAVNGVVFRDACVDDYGKSGTTSLSVREKL